MKTLISILSFLVLFLPSHSQFQTEWVKQIGGSQNELIYDLALDSEGNMVVLGAIDDYIGGETCDLDPGPGTTAYESSADGWHNIMLAKYDSLGNHLWSFVLWDEALDPQANKIDLDEDDNIYLTGTLTRQIDADPGLDTVLLDHNDGDFKTLFAIKYSPSGEYIWSDIFEGDGFSGGNQILVEDDQVFLCGQLSGLAYPGFNDTTTISTIWSNYNDGFIAKYDTDMNHVWSAVIAQGNGSDNVVSSIAVNDSGHLYAAGTFDGTADFDPDEIEESLLVSPLNVNDYSSDMFLAKYDVNGSLINAIGIGSDISFERVDEVFDLKIDQEGNLLVTGWFSGLIDFDPGLGVTSLTGDNDMFLAKYSADLDLMWCFSVAGTHHDIGKEIEIDAENDIYLHGQYYWNGDFDPGPDEFILSGSNQRGFLAKYTPDGEFISAVDIGIASSFGYEMHGMELKGDAVYLASYFYGEVDFDLDEDDEMILNSFPDYDIAIGKFQYFDPISHFIGSVEPQQIVDDGAVTLHIEGFDMEEVLEVSLISSTDTIIHQALEPISEFDLDVLIGLDEENPGFYDLHVLTEDSLMILTDAVEILPSALDLPAGGIDFLSTDRILLNRPEPSIGMVYNSGPKDMVAAPVIYRGIYEGLEFEAISASLDYSTDPQFTDLSTHLGTLGLDPSIMTEMIYNAPEGGMVAFIVPHLAAGNERPIMMRTTALDLEPSGYFMILHGNGLLDSEALLPSYMPAPSQCMVEMAEYTMINAAPDLDMTDFSNCFASSYNNMQVFLHDQIETGNDAQPYIPLRGLMMNLGYEMISCMDPTYDISAQVLDSVTVHMTRLLGTPIIFDEDFDCSNYVELSLLFKSQLQDDDSALEWDYLSLLEKNQTTQQCLDLGMSGGAGCTDFSKPCPEPQASSDPNEKLGPINVEAGTSHINWREKLSYSIHFENVDSATVAAKEVLIIDSLDTDVYDLSSVEFKYANWGDTIVSIEQGVNFFDLRPEQPNILKITAGVDTLSGVLTVDFETLDTLTMLLTFDIDQGFLPPNVNSPEGMGSVIFDIDLKVDLASGTSFENDALIYFDYNDPIATAAWQNTYDTLATASHVTYDFEVLNDESFVVNWESDDPEDPAYLYAVLVSINSPNDWELWQNFTTETSAVYDGVIGDTYYFMSAAVDSAFNLEALPTKADATFIYQADGLNEVTEMTFGLFPNPAKDEVTLQFINNDVERVEFFDVNGRHVYSGLNNRSNIHLVELEGIPQGVYHVRAWSDKGIMTQRLVIHR